jgi:hypothetical protein
MKANASLADGVLPFARILDENGLTLVERPGHRARRHEDASCNGIVMRDVDRGEREAHRLQVPLVPRIWSL